MQSMLAANNSRPIHCFKSSCNFPKAARHVHCSRPSTRCAAQEDSPTQADVCPTCGISNASRPKGCDGEGRIAGGLGAVVKWFPIKAYRPCPAAAKGNFAYTRRGQITDEVLFGKPKQKQ